VIRKWFAWLSSLGTEPDFAYVPTADLRSWRGPTEKGTHTRLVDYATQIASAKAHWHRYRVIGVHGDTFAWRLVDKIYVDRVEVKCVFLALADRVYHYDDPPQIDDSGEIRIHRTDGHVELVWREP
jgi:hypothetical protein